MSDCVCCCLWYYITTVSVLLKKQAAKRYRNRTEWKVIAQYIIKTQLPERLTRNKKDSLVKSMFKLEWNCSSVILAQSKLSNCTWKLLSRYICFKPQLFLRKSFFPSLSHWQTSSCGQGIHNKIWARFVPSSYCLTERDHSFYITVSFSEKSDLKPSVWPKETIRVRKEKISKQILEAIIKSCAFFLMIRK